MDNELFKVLNGFQGFNANMLYNDLVIIDEEKTTEIYSSYSEFIKTELDRIEVLEKERPEYSKCKY